MSKPEVTPWFPPTVPPARRGRYQRKYPQAIHRNAPDYWDGKKWWLLNVDGTPTGDECRTVLPWRGLAKNPRVPKTARRAL